MIGSWDSSRVVTICPPCKWYHTWLCHADFVNTRLTLSLTCIYGGGQVHYVGSTTAMLSGTLGRIKFITWCLRHASRRIPTEPRISGTISHACFGLCTAPDLKKGLVPHLILVGRSINTTLSKITSEALWPGYRFVGQFNGTCTSSCSLVCLVLLFA